MERRVTMMRSRSSTRPEMNALVGLLWCGLVGSAVGYYPQAQQQYNVVPNTQYNAGANPNYLTEQSQRLFWGNQGSNQVGGTGLWATLSNKFPFLANMFGRMELPAEYGVPNQLSSQYAAPQQQYQQYYQAPQYQQMQYQQQYPQQYQQQQYQQQQYQPQQYYQQVPSSNQFVRSFGRDVGFTDDAVIVTPPQVPIAAPAPAPAQPPAPADGYRYNKPQNRLELPPK